MQVKGMDKVISSPEAMLQFGEEIAPLLAKPNLILALSGDLGAGKTTFLKGFISALTETPPQFIQSPTFVYLQVYEGTYPLYHFDLYRLKHAEQFESAGFTDYLSAGGICCLEWADRIAHKLPQTTLFLDISYLGPHERRCTLYEKN
jgi:tRNA threonylcarbamoyladenosine biosynthesis protein TsaE